MTRTLFFGMMRYEAKLRLRRASTHAVLLALVLAVWFMIVDPSTGFVMLAANSARVAYNSVCLALGSSLLATVLLGLFGFYLVRGRADEDLRSGMGAVLAATPLSNAQLVIGRWAGGVLYLGALLLVLAIAVMLLQAVRGEGSIEPFTFFRFYALTLVPNVFFIAAMAVLCESWQPLTGKRGDILYFTFWLAQIVAPAILLSLVPDSSWPLMFDATGIGTLSQRAQEVLGTSSMAVGLNEFDKSLPAVVMTGDFWTWPMVLTRFLSVFVALVPLALAARHFHRFSPDKVAGRAKAPSSWAIGQRVARMLRPFDVVSRMLLRISARLPRAAGLAGAELALTCAANPLTGPLLAVFIGAGVMLDYKFLPAVMLTALLYWGVVIADISVRDFKADTEHMSTSATGRNASYWRQAGVTFLLGLLLTAPVLVRWAMLQPGRALALGAGLVVLTGLAQLLGRTTRSGRAFLVLFMFSLYLVTQGPPLPTLDVVGLHGRATAATISVEFLAGIALLMAGFGYNRRRGLQ